MYGPSSSSRKRSVDESDHHHTARDSRSKRARLDDRASGTFRRPVDRRSERVPESERARAWRVTKKAVVELCDNGGAARDDVVRTRDMVLHELDVDAQDVKLGHLATLVLQCATRLGPKTAVYATLTALVTARAPRFGRQVVELATHGLQADWDACHVNKQAEKDDNDAGDAHPTHDDGAAMGLRIRLTVRFLAALASVHVCQADDVVALLDTFQGQCRTQDEDEPGDDEHDVSSSRARDDATAWQDFLAWIVLDTLLSSGQDLAKRAETRVERVLGHCRAYIAHRARVTSGRPVPTSWRTRRLQLALLWQPERADEVPALCAASDPLTLGWDALESLRGGNEEDEATGVVAWTASGMSRPQDLFVSEVAHVEPLALPRSIILDVHKLDARKVPAYAPCFRIFTEDSGTFGTLIATLPLPTYLMLRTQFADALETLAPKPAIAATALLGLCRASNARLASSRSGTEASIQTEYLLIETLLVAALSDHAKPATLGAYCSLLYHLVKNDAARLSPAFAVVVELLFRQVANLRAAAVASFVLLLSHFVSNFDFKWCWSGWTYVLDAAEDDPQRLFVSAVIERCVRLSYLEHMERVLPSAFHVLLPPAPKPRIRFHATTDDAVDGTSGFYQKVTQKLQTHPPAPILRTWLDDEMVQVDMSRPEALEVVWTCILEAGAATFTHMRLLLEKYGPVLAPLVANDEDLVLVQTVAHVWLKSPQHIGLLVAAIVRHALLRPRTIMHWVCTSDAVQQYSWPYVWEIVHATLAFVQDDDGAPPARAHELPELLLHLFRGLLRVLREHMATCASDGVNGHDNWYRSLVSQLLEVGWRYRRALDRVLDELEQDVVPGEPGADEAKQLLDVLRVAYRSGASP
ncbi:hypothetical protein PsorP6_016464 [Peronosclerospora sorghi]|uniref:Uncharacterized protein n=1 Tax=Peronosclerospora sorghi TaxID=230839 RepID=A0ACC0VJS5_9STRA|nr:hypothetical protein PsorP6_016464 [Peronosclerospora sorghi]